MIEPRSTNFLLKIDSRYYPQFGLKTAYENADRIKILFYFIVLFFPLLAVLDYIRFEKGMMVDNLLYQLLAIDHLLFATLIFTSGQAIFHRKQIRKHEYPEIENLVSNFIATIIIVMLPMGILGIFERETLVVMTIYSVILNIILELDHRKSIIFNVSGFIISFIAILFYETEILKKLVTSMELIAVFGIPFIISRRQYNLKLREFEYKNILNEQNKIIQTEKDKSDKLLLNILPEEIAKELKENGFSEAHQFDDVTVLFTDFVNFTGISEKLTPQELVAEIHYCFKNFDAIIERHGLEKIKTIGDAYLAVSGLPQANKHHALSVIEAAIDIVEFINKYKWEKQVLKDAFWGVRIGINSGPVIAGIVGVKKFAYDIWGDTVNTAARMEQHSEAGKINISSSTYKLIKNNYTCEYRGKIAAKNKGMIDMYFLNMKSSYADAS